MTVKSPALAARPRLTSTDKTVLRALLETLDKTESQFCCGGTIRIPAERSVSLLYKVGVQGQANSGVLDLPAVNPEEVQKLLEVCTPSPHGRGNETVFDESYRLARELHQGSFALTTDILNQSGVLETIQALTSPRNPTRGLVADLYKLNAYATGGFFKPHRDTPKSDIHVGTLVIALPVPFKGGALRVSHESKQVLFDWGEDQAFDSDADTVDLPWAFLFSDVEHEVLPVTSGTRVTLAYDIFASRKVRTEVMDATTLPVYGDIKAALENPDFLPHGGRLGVTLSHGYPVDTLSTHSRSFATHLKGSDAALYSALSALGVSMEIRVVYQPYDGYDHEMHSEEVENSSDDEFGPVCMDKGDPLVLYTANSIVGECDDDQWDGGETQMLKDYVYASVERDIIWVRKPTLDDLSDVGRYIAYGNQASVSTVYAAAALVLDLSARGSGGNA